MQPPKLPITTQKIQEPILPDFKKSRFLHAVAPVVQKVDNATHVINLYPGDSAIDFPNTYTLDSDLSCG